MDHSTSEIQIKDFINKELILFCKFSYLSYYTNTIHLPTLILTEIHLSQKAMADNIRSIPSVVDGLKPGQRKIMFSCFKRNLKGEMKVAQLTGKTL